MQPGVGYIYTMNTDTTAALIDTLTFAVPDTFTVAANTYGGVDIRVDPKAALRADVDFVRVIRDDNVLRVLHMTHNEVLRGEVTLTGSMTGLLAAVVRNIVEAF